MKRIRRLEKISIALRITRTLAPVMILLPSLPYIHNCLAFCIHIDIVAVSILKVLKPSQEVPDA